MKTSGWIGLALFGTGVAALGCASSGAARAEPSTGETATAAPPAQTAAPPRGQPPSPRGKAKMHGMGMRHGMGMMADVCPMYVQDTTVRAEDVEGGVALEFTTKTGDVADLRQRVRRMAEMHDQRAERMTSGTGPRGRGRGMKMPPATASAEDIEGGARLVLRPKDPADLDTLRGQLRLQAMRMAEGDCPMMRPASGQVPSSGKPSPSR